MLYPVSLIRDHVTKYIVKVKGELGYARALTHIAHAISSRHTRKHTHTHTHTHATIMLKISRQIDKF